MKRALLGVAAACATALALAVLQTGCAHDATSGAGVPPNLALGRPSLVEEGAGQPSLVTDGRLAREGDPPDEGVRLAGERSAVVVDLGEPRELRALLLQASGNDVYFVESSLDTRDWTLLWRVPPLLPEDGLRTRTAVMPSPANARWLRVRATTARAPAVAELQAFATAPAAWPQLDTSRPGSALPLWPMLTADRLAALFNLLSVLLLLATTWSLLARRLREGRLERRLRRGLLALVAAASLAAWPNAFNLHYHERIHHWEFAHYYLGSKYFTELGYTNLYACAALADAEDGIDLGDRPIRDLRDNRIVPSGSELARAGDCRSRFSAADWDRFRSDARFFRGALGPGTWADLRRDHGFNATPAWALLGGALARLSAASPAALGALALLDVLLLLGTFAVLGAAFGFEAACLAAGYFGVNTLAPFGWTGGGFLRYDWLFWLVAGVASLHAGRKALAGFALVYAASLRVFPGLALAALGLKLALECVAARSLRPTLRHGRLALGALLALALCVVGPTLATGRPGVWLEFARNSAKHLSSEATNNVGLPAFLSFRSSTRVELMSDPLRFDRHSLWEHERGLARRSAAPAQWAAVGAFLVILGIALRRSPDWAAATLGLGLMPMLFVLSSYYYSAFVTMAALWPISGTAGLLLAALGWATNAIKAFMPELEEQHAYLSLALVAFVISVTAAVAWRRSEPAKLRQDLPGGEDRP